MMHTVMRYRRCWIASLMALLVSAGCAYDNPVQPIAVGVDLTAPFQVTVGASPGSGAQAGTATVMAHVQNASGAALSNVLVTFTTSRGSIDPSSAATGVDGTATTTLVASDTATVTAAAGMLTAHAFVAAVPPTPAIPTPTPTPPPPPTPAPIPPAVFLNVSGSATTNVPLALGVSSAATGVTWVWSFGDGSTDQTTAFNTTHTYKIAGTYAITVSAVGTSVAGATIVVSDPVVAKSVSRF
jgi:PKD repeat protein